jgi:hypothetical protein
MRLTKPHQQKNQQLKRSNMNAYLMNGTNTVTPLNATNRAVPMNVVDPATITIAITVGKTIAGIIAKRRQTKKEKAEAHTAFMNEVYKIPGLTNEDHRFLHQMAEHNLEDAVRWVENYLAAKIVEAEEAQKRELEEAQKKNTSPGSSILKSAIQSASSRRDVEKQTDELIDNYGNYTGAETRIKNQGNWWANRSTVEKGLIIGGSALAVGGIIYLATRKRKKKSK